MTDFHKRYVRVEWLAIEKAVDLMREAGFNETYFVSSSLLIADEGRVPELAKVDRELYDGTGAVVRYEKPSAADFGLAEDLGEFAPSEGQEIGCGDQSYFLKRMYEFVVYKKGEKNSSVNIFVGYAKKLEQSDWELVHECVTDQRRAGDARWVILRKK